uniref:Uncharacterized protein n=1 Tax=Amphimedon queenslandica TaxID=400682 RepID=A0A1X7TE95_AMPQE
MGSNIQPHSIAKAAKSIGIVDDVCRKFEIEMKGQIESMGPHSKPSSQKDVKLIINELRDSRALSCLQGMNARQNSFNISKCLLDSLDRNDFHVWLTENIVPCIIFK